MVRQLDSFVSGKIARTNPLEGGPAFEAWQNGTSVMASTWGDYVSRLAELVPDDEIQLDDLLAKLCIGREELQDPTVHFGQGNPYEFGDYEEHFRRVTHKEAEDYYAPEVTRLQMTLDAILEGYKVSDQTRADEEADAVQEQYDEHNTEQNARCMRRDALRSGVVIPLAEFVDTMLQVNLIHDGDFKSELAHLWVRALSSAIENFYHKYNYAPDMPVDRIVVGQELFADMRGYLRNIWKEKEAHYKQRWQEVKPVFITNYIDEHPLVTGLGEK